MAALPQACRRTARRLSTRAVTRGSLGRGPSGKIFYGPARKPRAFLDILELSDIREQVGKNRLPDPTRGPPKLGVRMGRLRREIFLPRTTRPLDARL